MIDPVAIAVQRAIADSGECEAGRCPEAPELIAFAEGGLDDIARDRIAACVANCAGCASALRVALDASAWSDELAADLERTHPQDSNVVPMRARAASTRRRKMWIPTALAASLAVLVGAGVMLRQPDAGVAETLRGQAPIATQPADGARLAKVPLRLAWPCAAAPNAATVDILAVDASLLWTGEVEACAVSLPIAAHARIGAGETLWRVLDSNGATLLGPIAFHVEP